MKRREFMTLLGGAACVAARGAGAAARAHATHRRAHEHGCGDPTGQARLLAFAQALAQAGWTDGRNVRIDIRWDAGDPEGIRKYAAELVAPAPDVILASGGNDPRAIATGEPHMPTVFTGVGDPVGAGFVDSLARPGGNATGFIAFEWSVSGKWLELLKEIAPGVTRAVVLRDSELGSGASQFAVIQAVAPSLRVEVNPVNVGGAAEIETRCRGICARSEWRPNRDRRRPDAISSRPDRQAGGPPQAARGLLRSCLRRLRRPDLAMGLISSTSSGAPPATSISVLKGEKPADLPVQAPTKYETVINLKTAKALGLDVPPTLLARADEVIE